MFIKENVKNGWVALVLEDLLVLDYKELKTQSQSDKFVKIGPPFSYYTYEIGYSSAFPKNKFKDVLKEMSKRTIKTLRFDNQVFKSPFKIGVFIPDLTRLLSKC